MARIVDGVTKLDRVQFDSKAAQQAATMRKMLVAMAKDLRVLIIKLADRLHNMRTLGAMSPDSQARIARETLDVYAPLAHRLGMQDLKQQLEDLSFATLHPKQYAEIDHMVASRAPERELYLEQVADRLRSAVRRENDTLARIGGDEFLILLTDVSQRTDIENFIRLLFEKFRPCLQVGSPPLEVQVGFSVGVALYPQHGKDPDTLIRNADSAMYQAKKMEKNCYCFYDPGKITADEVKNLPAGPDTTCG